MRIVLLILTIASAAFGIAAQSSLRTFSRPALSEENFLGLEKAACVALDSAAKICQGLTETGAAKFVVQRGGEVIGEWDSATFLGETADYQVFKGDLDADKTDELIVANLNAVSNGMGVRYWTIAVLPFPNGQDKLTPIEFRTEDFSVAAFSPRKKGGFDMTATSWETFPVGKTGNRAALYFVGRSFVYRNGGFETSAKPILIRRYLASFERERWKNIEDNAASYDWLKSKTTEKRFVEPLLDLNAGAETDANIESFTSDKNAVGEPNGYKIAVKTKSGDSLSLVYAGNTSETAEEIDFIGDFANKKLYPKGYLPEKMSVGKSVKLVAYSESKSGAAIRRVLWLMN